MIDETKLMTIRNYAKLQGHSTAWIYKKIEKGKLEIEIIDGFKFVVVDKEDELKI